MSTDLTKPYVAITDDSGNGPAAVKPPSTAAVAADPALVVAISPNNVVSVTQAAPNSVGGLQMGKSIASGSGDGAYTPILATTYNEPTVGAQRSISSSSAADTAAGTGARTVEITYYKDNFTGPFTEIVALNGAVAVNTVAVDICFIEKMVVLTAGTSGRNAGTITLFNAAGGGGGTLGILGIANLFTDAIGAPAVTGDNRTLWAHHYVPPGKTATFSTVTGGTGGNQTGTIFMVNRAPLVTSPEIIIGDPLAVGLNATGVVRQLGIPIVVDGPARVRLIVVPNGNGTTFYGSFDFSEA